MEFNATLSLNFAYFSYGLRALNFADPAPKPVTLGSAWPRHYVPRDRQRDLSGSNLASVVEEHSTVNQSILVCGNMCRELLHYILLNEVLSIHLGQWHVRQVLHG